MNVSPLLALASPGVAMQVDATVAIAVAVVVGACVTVRYLRVRSVATDYDGAPRARLRAQSPDGTQVSASLDPPRG